MLNNCALIIKHTTIIVIRFRTMEVVWIGTKILQKLTFIIFLKISYNSIKPF